MTQLNPWQFYTFAKKYHLTQEVIDEMAIPSYTHASSLVRWVFMQRLQKLTNNVDFKNKTILDFGCGAGILFPKYLSARKIYACDLYPQIAKETAKMLKLNVHFISELEIIPDKSVDIAIFADVLEHITDYDTVILKVRSKMKNNGILLISLPTESRFYKFCRIMVGYGAKGHYHRINPQDIVAFLDTISLQKGEKNFPFLFTLFKLIKIVFRPSMDDGKR